MTTKGRIPDRFKDELLARTDIVELINSYVPLKKAGATYKACCPFHDEKTPSFNVNAGKQFYHCFGCGVSGNAISFVMDYLHLDYVAAIEQLASMAGLEVPREAGSQPPAKPSLTRLYDIVEWVAQFYQQQLHHEQVEQTPVASYVQKRGLNQEIIDRYRIGYAMPGWDTLSKKSQKAEGLKLLSQAGLLIEKDNGRFYDRFRDRLMFPIRDPRGRVIAFGGRIFPHSDEQSAKYLNSPETEIFSKSYVLYGLYEARRYCKKLDILLVVEGYMDVVALARHGIQNAVATLGTAVTTHHIKQLFRTVDQLVFSFDGDAAGMGAAWKALNILLPHIHDGRQARFLVLPEGEDPDSLVQQQGREAFLQQLQNALPLSEFMFGQLCKDVDLNSIDGKALLVERAKPLLAEMVDGVYKKMVAQRLSELTLLPSNEFGGVIEVAQPDRHKPAAKRPRAAARQAEQPGQISLVRKAIAILLQNPHLAEHASPRQFEVLTMPGMDLFMALLAALHEQPGMNTAMLLEKWRGSEYSGALYKLANLNLGIPEMGMEEEFSGAVLRFAEKAQQQQLDDLLQKSRRQALSEEEKSQLNTLLKRR